MSKKPKRSHRPNTATPVLLTQQATTPTDSSRLIAILRYSGFGLLGLAIAAYVWPDQRLWGIHHLNFLSLPVAIALICCAAICWTPVGGSIVSWLIRRLHKLSGRPILIWMAPVLALLWLLSVSVPLLGDGALWVVELSWVGKFQARGTDAPPGRWKSRKEPLELELHELVFRVAAPLFPPNPSLIASEGPVAAQEQRSIALENTARLTYRWLSIAAGLLALYVALRFARRRLPPPARLPFVLVLFSGGGILLFFGYVEHYTWVSLSVILFLLAGLEETFPPRRFPWRSLLAFALAVSFHLAAVFLLPALLFLMLRWAARKSAMTPEQMAWRVLALFAVLGVAGYIFVKGWKGWLSISPLLPQWSRDGYALLSMPHMIDLLNLCVLVAIPAVIVLALLRRSASAPLYERTQAAFLALAAGCGGAFVVSFDPNLGMACDWDLLAVALWPVAMLAAWKIARVDWQECRPRVIAAICGFTLLITLPYVLVQARESTSVRRFESLLALNPTRSAYGWENLSQHYRMTGNLDGRIRALRAACTVSNNPRYRVNLSAALRQNGQLEEAEPLCISAVREKPEYVDQLVRLAIAYGKKGSGSKALELLALAQQLNPADSTAARVIQEVNRHQAMIEKSEPD